MSVENATEFKSFTSVTGENGLKARIDEKRQAENNDIVLTEAKESKSGNVLPDEKEKPVGIVEQVHESAEPDNEVILEKLKQINEQFPLKSTSLIFEFDDANDPPVVKVVDKESGDVIREIPPKELREIAQALSDIADNLNGDTNSQQGKRSSGILINERL